MTSATVETLTAEVRTLVVGSRQITLSVARQLDVVLLSRLTVMGRIRLSKTKRDIYDAYDQGWGDAWDWVVGADSIGNLALARYQTRPYIRVQNCPYLNEVGGHDQYDGDDDKLSVCTGYHQEVARVALHQAAAASPLIVLAGLR